MFKEKKYCWTQEKDDLLRQHYDGKVQGRVSWIAEQLGWPTWQIKRRAGALGLAHPADSRDWTEIETAFLRDYLRIASVNWISKKLGRSVASVAMKLKHEKIQRAVNREGYTMRSLEESFGMDHRVIKRWIDTGWLRARRRGNQGEEKRDYWYCTERDVLKFIIDHPLEFRLDKVNQEWFMELITGGRENAERLTKCAVCERFPGDDPVVEYRPTGDNENTEIWIHCRDCEKAKNGGGECH